RKSRWVPAYAGMTNKKIVRSVPGRLGGHERRDRVAAGEGFLQCFVLVVAFVVLALPAFLFRFLSDGLVFVVLDVFAIAIWHGGMLRAWPSGKCRTPRVNPCPAASSRIVHAACAQGTRWPVPPARTLHMHITTLPII